MLAWLTRTLLLGGVIAAFGNAEGVNLFTTVLPFILRGVRLLGVNATAPMPLREAVWRKIATDYRPARLDRIAHVIGLQELPVMLDRMLAGATRGRCVIDMQRPH